MSIIKYEKEMTPCRVKTKERGDVDLTRLVKHGAASRIVPAMPIYADLTDLPRSRGEAAQRQLELLANQNPEFVSALLKLPPAQALQHLMAMRPPAPNTNDKTNVIQQGPLSPKTPPNGPPAPPQAAQ